MPGKVKVKIIAGKNLPVMDRSSDTTDAYVEIKLGGTTYKTDVCRKSLNPQWNSDWYRFEADDSELQDEPLQIRLMDHDTYSANDAIGKVYLNLNPLLLPSGSLFSKFGIGGEPSTNSEHVTNSVMSGWIPVYDTMHGIRGEVNVIVKVELFSDFNKFRQSSCGVQFFCSPTIPHGYYAQMFHGFVEELIVNDDPEYQWIDKIRTPRASNEARQTLFFKLSGELQRRIGVKALELGGNAVVGYSQCFDLEGESGVVVRGIGTAVTLIRLRNAPTTTVIDTTNEERALSYLQFLRYDSSFHLNRDNCTNSLQSVPSLSTSTLCLQHLPDYEPIDSKGKRNFTRHLSYCDFNPPKFVPSTNRPVSDGIHHASSLQTLLQQEEMRGIPGTGISQRIKNLKYSSQNILAKKMTALKAKLSDSGMQEEDDASIGGSSSTASLLEITKKKSLFPKTVNESSGMAELLVRSLMHTSLDCIVETHDDITLSSSSSSPTVEFNIPTDGITESINQLNKSVSESLLYKPNILLGIDLLSSNINSSSDSSSSDGDETVSDVRDEVIPEFDTVSNIIKNVKINSVEIPPEDIQIDLGDDRSDIKIVSDAAPLAEFEDFDIGGSTPVHFLVGDDDDFDVINTIDLDGANSEYMLLEHVEPKSIIPQVHMCTNTDKALIKTAMQTILLEQLKIVGTYTPPSSPSLVNKEKDVFTLEPMVEQSFFPQISSTLDLMRKSPIVSLKNSDNVIEPSSHIKQTESAEKIDDNNTEEVVVNPFSFPATQNVISTNYDEKKFNTIAQTSCLKTNSFSVPVNSELDKGSNNMHASLAHSLRPVGSPAAEPIQNDHGHQRTESVGGKVSQSPAKFHPIPLIHRRSSDSDLSITPKGNSLTGSDKSYGLPTAYFSRVGALLRQPLPQENFDMLEYPFLTLSKYPPGFIVCLGGVVSARSVKLLERITNLEEPESRDTWWTELRLEIRSHARSIGCNSVLAYSETTSICDDVCVLSASGTAAVIGFQYTGEISDSISGLPVKAKTHYSNKDPMATSLDRNDFEREKVLHKPDSIVIANTVINTKPLPESPENETNSTYVNNLSPCTICHLPYGGSSIPLRTKTVKCAVCRMGKVPDVILATVEIPEGIPSVGRGCFIQAHVCRQLKDSRSESSAKDISDGLPFLEYELHRILINKIKIKGMNAVFGLKVRISIGVKTLVGIATGTGVFLLPLPAPPLPKLVSDRSIDEKKLIEMQKLLSDTVRINKETYQLKLNDDLQSGRISPDENSEDDQSLLDSSGESRDCCILEVDDPEDLEIMNLLMEPRPPDGFHVVNTELVPGLDELEIVKNLQMFTQIWRSKFHLPYNLGRHIHKLLQCVYFKLRRMIPCAICDLQFRIDLPESDEIQLTVLGMALGLGINQNALKYKRKNAHISLKDARKHEEDMIFNLEEDHPEPNTISHPLESGFLNVQPVKHRGKSPQRNKFIISKQHKPHRERHGVDITPLSYVPGGKIERYLGNLNFFFIRETTSIREEGGLSGFIHSFITEVLAIVRAHIAALGGNAMVAYYMTKCVLSHSLHKNQGQCLINVGGDVVFVSYFAEE